ncbi:MAG: glycoside hydrolase family 43 protein [Chitinispirillaceae bacterium]|nr:glycoside hydrolase family 43 protein [Chitinispirillaceae bacterium]
MMNYLKVPMFALALPIFALAQLDTNSQHFYLFSYFLNSDDAAGARLAVSSDAVFWQKINNENPVIVPILSEEHLMRDPCIYYDTSTGVFHLVWTTGWNQKNIGYAAVRDLRNWGSDSCTQVMLPVGEDIPNCACCWAPEIFYDDIKDSFMVFWSTERGTAGKRTYYCMTKDFKTITASTMFFDPGYSVIDAATIKVDSARYYMFFKDERTGEEAGTQSKNIHYVYGPTPQGPWGAISKWITITNCEGPSPIKIGNEYRVYFDPYFAVSSSYRMVKVTDLNTTASPWPQGDILMTETGIFNLSHGTILEIPRVKLMQLLYGVPDTTTYAPWELPTPPVHIDPGIPEGKRNCGCGTGTGLALIPPLFFKAAAYRKRKNRSGQRRRGGER